MFPQEDGKVSTIKHDESIAFRYIMDRDSECPVIRESLGFGPNLYRHRALQPI
jgi:hypothetical protein